MTLDAYSVSVEAGPGVVARLGPAVVVVGGDGDWPLQVTAGLRDALGETPGADDFVRVLRADDRFISGTVDLVVAIGIPGALRVLVGGRMEARTEDNEVIAGAQPVERDLPGARALWIGHGGPPARPAHPVLDLRAGVVRGRGAVVYLSPASSSPQPDSPPPQSQSQAPQPQSSQPQAAQPLPPNLVEAAVPGGVDPTNPGRGPLDLPPPPAPAVPSGGPDTATPVPDSPSAPMSTGGPASPETMDGSASGEIRPFRSVDWSEPAETRAPLPVAGGADDYVDARRSAEQIMGIRCSRDHFNNPKAGYCQVCGISMVQLTHRLEPGPRPTLGFVVFADGATYAVDRPYLIGRSPRPDRRSGQAAIITQDASHSVSREHGELRLEGWDVRYIDRGSTNGSYLWEPDRQAWRSLQPDESVELRSGTTISVGRMSFVFQGASKAVEER